MDDDAHPQSAEAPQRMDAAAAVVAPISAVPSETKAQKLRQDAAYAALTPEVRGQADAIIKAALTRPNADYYLDKLLIAIRTPSAPAEETAQKNRRLTDASLAEAASRTLETIRSEGVEEAHTADPGRVWSVLQGDTATYRVDRRDPTDFAVTMKVHLNGDAAELERIKMLEDPIEKRASTRGYTFDLEFVDHSGADVFEAGADPTKWATASNWTAGTGALAHEAHHRLGLADRYDYIESHSGNQSMSVATRLHWFSVQMSRPSDPDGQRSLMGRGQVLLDNDVCKVAKVQDPATCVDARTKTLGPR